MILTGLGFVSAPLYLFGEFFIGKATVHFLGEMIKPEHLNDDRIGRALDSLSNQGLITLESGKNEKQEHRYSKSRIDVLYRYHYTWCILARHYTALIWFTIALRNAFNFCYFRLCLRTI